METGKTRIEAGSLTFALHYRNRDGGAAHGQEPGERGGDNADQGVSIQVMGDVDGREVELLRFNCFEIAPHYHYDPAGANTRVMLDTTVNGNPLAWSVKQLGAKLPAMLKKAGYEGLASDLDTSLIAEKLPEVEAAAREMALSHRDTVTHSRGTQVIEAGNIRFGLEMRIVGPDGGPAIHVLGDVAGQEIELLAFDCFRVYPHYHYGPRNRNERTYWDTTLVDDPLGWTLDQFKSGKLPKMLVRAGYPTIAADLDEELLAAKLPVVESTLRAMIEANPG